MYDSLRVCQGCLFTGIIRKAVREPLHYACNILAKVVLNVLEPQHPAVSSAASWYPIRVF